MTTAESPFETTGAPSSTAPAPDARTVRAATTVARVLLGILFFVFGLNGFFNFIPRPQTPPPDGAMAFVGGLMASGYFFPFLKGTEVIAGLALLANRYVPLALTVLAPIVLNIALFHFILAPSGWAVAAVILVLEIYLAWSYRSVFAPVLGARVSPS